MSPTDGGGPLPAAHVTALDWHRRCRLVGPRGSWWSLPASDLVLTGLLGTVVIADIDFVRTWGPHPAYLANLALTVLVAAAQPWRHRAPVASAALTYTALACLSALVWISPVNLGVSPVIVAAPTALHSVTRWARSPRWGTAALLGALAGCIINPVSVTAARGAGAPGPAGAGLAPGADRGAVLFTTACVLAVAIVFLSAATSRRRAEETDQAARAAARSATTQAVVAERLAVAREIHDLVGHGLTVVKVQADTALALGGQDTMEAALRDIRQAAASSLASVREMVTLLRGSSLDAAPAPLADTSVLPALVDQARAAGLELDAQLPEPEILVSFNTTWTALQRLALVRTVTEGLTNAVRHGASPAELSVSQHGGRCHVYLDNALRGTASSTASGTASTHEPPPADARTAPSPERDLPAAAPPGSRLAGLAERLRLVGGTLGSGTRGSGSGVRFVLEASFPVPAGGTDQSLEGASHQGHR